MRSLSDGQPIQKHGSRRDARFCVSTAHFASVRLITHEGSRIIREPSYHHNGRSATYPFGGDSTPVTGTGAGSSGGSWFPGSVGGGTVGAG